MSARHPAARRRAAAHPDQLLLSFEDLGGFEPPDRHPVSAVDARTAAPMSARPGVEGRVAGDYPGKADPGRREVGTMDAIHWGGRRNPDRARPGRTSQGRGEAPPVELGAVEGWPGRSGLPRLGPDQALLISCAAALILTFATLRGLGCSPHDAAGVASAFAVMVGGIARGREARAR